MENKLIVEKFRVGADFIQQNGHQYHDALGEKTLFNQQTAMFESLSEPENSAPDNDLRHALEEYNATAERKYQLNLTSCSLNEVLLEIADAEGRYKANGRGVVNYLRQAGRIAGNYADAIAPWLDLIPSDNNLNLLSAGLKAVLSIAKKNAENRDKIIKGLGEIPDMMLQTQRQRYTFSDVPGMREKAIALYKVLVQSLARLIATLNPRKSEERLREQAKRWGKKLVPYYTAAGIDQILGDMNTSVRRFGESLQLIRDEYLRGAYDNSKKNLIQGDCIQTDVKYIEEGVGYINQDLRSLSRSFEEYRKEQQIKNEEALNSQNNLLVYIVSDPPTSPFITPYTGHSPHQEPFLSDTELFYTLRVQFNKPNEDIDFTMKQLGQFGVAAQAQAQQLLSSEEFIGWIKSPTPLTLFVKGNFHMAGAGRISALSTLCATFALNLSKSTNYIILNAFYVSLLNYSSGVKFSTDFINTRSFTDQIKSHNVQDLCSVFRQLIEQLPKTAIVICIIDGVTCFESENWIADLIDVFFILNQIILNDFLRPTFKLLLTTPFSKSRFIENSGAIWFHYTISLQSAAAGGRRISERGLVPGRSLEEYRAKMEEIGANEQDDSDDDHLFF